MPRHSFTKKELNKFADALAAGASLAAAARRAGFTASFAQALFDAITEPMGAQAA